MPLLFAFQSRGSGVVTPQRGPGAEPLALLTLETLGPLAGSALMTSSWPCLPPPSRTAFLLDFDGTLVDIAPSPDLVVVPAALPGQLARLRCALWRGAGDRHRRPIAQVDGYFGGRLYAVAGEHGTAIRHGPGEAVVLAHLPELPGHWAPGGQGVGGRDTPVRSSSRSATDSLCTTGQRLRPALLCRQGLRRCWRTCRVRIN